MERGWDQDGQFREAHPNPEQDLAVVARRRGERALDVPISITAFRAEDIRNRSAEDISFLDGGVPNVSFDVGTIGVASSAIPAIYIRGIGQDDYLSTTDPGVGVYLDGVYLGRTVGQNLSTIDLAQVEVLRGPQGTLFGRNTIGGAINLRLRRPSRDPQAFARLVVGSDSLVDLAARADLPLNDKVLTSISVNRRRRDGFASSPNAADLDFGDENRLLLRGQLTLHPTETLTLGFTADWSQQEEESEPTFVYGSDFANPNTLVGLYNAFAPLLMRDPIGPDDITPLSRPFDISQTGPSRDDLEVWGIAATAEWAISDHVSLKSTTAYRTSRAHIENDQDSIQQLAATFDSRLKQEQFSQELQLSRNLGASSLVAGLYFFSENARDDTLLSVVPGLFGALEALPAALVPIARVPVDPAGNPAFSCPDAPPGFPCAGGVRNPINIALDQTTRLFGDLDVKNIAGYAHAQIGIFDALTISIGGRLTHERKSFLAFQSKVEPSQALGESIYNLTPRRSTADWTRFSPHLDISYRLAEDSIIYVTYDQGFRSGTFNGRANSEATFTEVSPETVNAYEVGIKGRLADNRMVVSLAAFYSDYKDMQVRAVIPSTSGLDVFFVNAAKSHIAGFEGELFFENRNGFQVGGTFAFADSKVEKVDPFVADSTGVNEGNALPKTPRFSWSGFAQYEFSLSNRRISLRSDLNWRSKVFHDAANTNILGAGSTKESAYALLNARATFKTSDERLEWAIWGKNLTKQVRYASLVANAGGLLVAYPVRGREVGLALTVTF